MTAFPPRTVFLQMTGTSSTSMTVQNKGTRYTFTSDTWSQLLPHGRVRTRFAWWGILRPLSSHALLFFPLKTYDYISSTWKLFTTKQPKKKYIKIPYLLIKIKGENPSSFLILLLTTWEILLIFDKCRTQDFFLHKQK